MSEGEFKKRLRFDFIGDSRTVTEIPVEYIIQMLDEAHKEWPTEEMALKILQETPNFFAMSKWEGGLAEAAKQQILASLRQDWFLKWFGEKRNE